MKHSVNCFLDRRHILALSASTQHRSKCNLIHLITSTWIAPKFVHQLLLQFSGSSIARNKRVIILLLQRKSHRGHFLHSRACMQEPVSVLQTSVYHSPICGSVWPQPSALHFLPDTQSTFEIPTISKTLNKDRVHSNCRPHLIFLKLSEDAYGQVHSLAVAARFKHQFIRFIIRRHCTVLLRYSAHLLIEFNRLRCSTALGQDFE
mmetsp:Transcript_5449/g.16248  ORF Transcript_5449/g.16248 Transcript_5449/m.16248 type:complete len:205 (+) Transcript_5449:407-1021(+)